MCVLQGLHVCRWRIDNLSVRNSFLVSKPTQSQSVLHCCTLPNRTHLPVPGCTVHCTLYIHTHEKPINPTPIGVEFRSSLSPPDTTTVHGDKDIQYYKRNAVEDCLPFVKVENPTQANPGSPPKTKEQKTKQKKTPILFLSSVVSIYLYLSRLPFSLIFRIYVHTVDAYIPFFSRTFCPPPAALWALAKWFTHIRCSIN